MSMKHIQWAMEQDVQGGNDKSVLLVLAWHANGGDSGYPSIETIVRQSACSRATVFRSLNALTAAGLVAVETRNGKGGRLPNVYRLQLANGNQVQDGEGPSETYNVGGSQGEIVRGPVSLTVIRGGSQPATECVSPCDPNPVLNPEGEERSPPVPPQEGGRRVSCQSLPDQKALTLTGAGGEPLTDLVDRAVTIWNREAGDKRKIRVVAGPRREVLVKRLRTHFDNNLERWELFCRLVKASEWLNGGGKGNWFASFDWCLREDRCDQILNGGYPPKKEGGLRSYL